MLVLVITSYFLFDLNAYFSLVNLKTLVGSLGEYISRQPLTSATVYFLAYVAMAAFSLPGAAIMTLAGGALFGLFWGVALASFASSIGAVLAFLVARYMAGEWVERRFGNNMEAINRGLEREGSFYLFSIRMVPLFPFFLVNLLMALTRMRIVPFYLVSQLGMFPATLVFVFAGTELAKLDSVSDVLNPGLIAAFVLLGLFPWMAKYVLKLIGKKERKLNDRR